MNAIELVKLLMLHWRVRQVLRGQGFAAALAIFAQIPLANSSTPVTLKQANSAARWLRRRSRFAGDRACLDRSLCLCAWLRNKGADATLKIGARHLHNRLIAHAWVEWQGVPILEAADVKSIHTEFSDPRKAWL